MKRFDYCKNLDELKKAYKAAAFANHPDRGGDTATMQEINAEYSAKFEELKNRQNTAAAEDKSGKTYATSESAEDFIDIVNHLLKMDGIEIELCGRWLWIGGDTKNHKDELKACGCRWSPNKKLWSWHFAEDSEAGYKHRHGRTYSMDHIRNKYGSTTFGTVKPDALPV